MTKPEAHPENGANDPVGDVGYMRTALDLVVNPLDLQPEDVLIEDIARSLSRQCRYGGHVGGFLSVARHCLWVGELLAEAGFDDDVVLQGLVHDAAEAYIGDVIRPLKYRTEMSAYMAIEADVEVRLFAALGVTYPFHPAVHEADSAAGHLERAYHRHTYHGDFYRDELEWLGHYHTLKQGAST